MEPNQIADALDQAAQVAAFYAQAGEEAGGAGGVQARADQDTLLRWAKHYRDDLSK